MVKQVKKAKSKPALKAGHPVTRQPAKPAAAGMPGTGRPDGRKGHADKRKAVPTPPFTSFLKWLSS